MSKILLMMILVIPYRDPREKSCISASFPEFYGVTSAIRSAMKSLNLKMEKIRIFGAKTDCSSQADLISI